MALCKVNPATLAPLLVLQLYTPAPVSSNTGLSQSRQELGCQGTVDQIVTEIRQMGTSVRVTVDSEHREVFDLALQGQGSVYFLLPDSGTPSTKNISVARNIMNSPALQKAYARRIFSKCLGTGSVDFGFNHSDWFKSYVFTSSGVLLERFCSHDRNDPVFRRRATYVDHPTGRSLHGSCTYIYTS